MSNPAFEYGPECVGAQRQPDLELVCCDQNRLYFDPENLPDIEQIDLDPIKVLRRVDYSPGQAQNLDVESSVRYLSEASVGSMDDRDFKDSFGLAIGKILEDDLSPEYIESIYDTIEAQKPRVIQLMQRVRREEIMLDEQYVTINKIVMFIAGIRIAKNI